MSTSGYTPQPNGWRTFLVVWATQSVSVLGSALTHFSIIVWLTTTLYPAPGQKPQLAWALSALSLSFALPHVIVGPLAGAWADRHDRKRTMMAMDFASGCLSTFIVALILTRQLNLPLLVVIGVLNAAFSAFHFSAFDTSYAVLVPEDRLPRANGMMETIQALSGILAPGLAAALIALPALARQGHLPSFAGSLARVTDGAALAVGLDAVTFFLASGTLLFLHVPSPRRADLHLESGAKKSLWADVQEGALYIWHRRSFLWLLGTFTVVNFSIGAFVLQPLLVKFQLGPDWSARGYSFETALALLATVASVGGVLGGIVISASGGLKRRRVYGVVVANIVVGLGMIVFGRSTGLYLTAGVLFVIDAMHPVMNSHSQSIWQSQTPRELQGRVFAVRRLIAQFSWPMGNFVVGLLATRFDPGLICTVFGLGLMLWCTAMLFNPWLLRIEDKDWIEAQAAKNAGVELIRE